MRLWRHFATALSDKKAECNYYNILVSCEGVAQLVGTAHRFARGGPAKVGLVSLFYSLKVPM